MQVLDALHTLVDSLTGHNDSLSDVLGYFVVFKEDAWLGFLFVVPYDVPDFIFSLMDKLSF